MTTEYGYTPQHGQSIAGRFPGGPRRSSPGETPRQRPALPDVSAQANSGAQRTVRRLRVRRRKRLAIGFMVMLVFATGAGFYLGHAAETPLDELRASPAEGMEDVVSSEVTRVLMELWKMEDVEAARAQRR